SQFSKPCGLLPQSSQKSATYIHPGHYSFHFCKACSLLKGRVRIGAPGRAHLGDNERNTMLNSSMTVREVAIELPQSTRLFERLKIDYCCGGNRPLTEACASIGVEVGEIMGMLETLSE